MRTWILFCLLALLASVPCLWAAEPCPPTCPCGQCQAGCDCQGQGKPCGSGLCICAVQGKSHDQKLPPIRRPCCQAPAPAPAPAPGLKEELPAPRRFFFGVEPDKRGQGPRYLYCDGKDCHSIDREEARRLIEASVPDDANLPRLTAIVADASLRKQIQEELKSPLLASHQGAWLVQFYDPAEPTQKKLLSLRGFRVDLPVAIYLQKSTGHYLLPGARGPVESYPGAEGLKQLLDLALGRTPPTPPGPPGPNPPGPNPPGPVPPGPVPPGPNPDPCPDRPWWRQVPLTAWVMLGFVLYLIWTRKRD